MISKFRNIAAKLTVRKVWNGVRLYASFIYSRLTGKATVWGMPISVSIEPGTACNLRCPQCPSGLRQFTRETGMLDPALFAKIIKEIKKDLCTLTMYFQGEPYLNKNFTEMVKVASDQNIFTITSTNGHYLDDKTCHDTVMSGLGELIISVDGSSQQSYAAYRIGGQLEKVLDGTRRILKHKAALKSSTPHVVWQFIVFRHNEKEVPEIKKMAKQAGVNEVRIKTAQVYDPEADSDVLPTTAAYARYEKTADGNYRVKNPLFNHCWRMWRSCVITWKGEVVPCCFDKDASYKLGVVTDRSFSDIWQSAPYNSFRERVLTSRKSIDICTNCSEGTKIWA